MVTRYRSQSGKSNRSGCGFLLLLALVAFLGYRAYTWYVVWSDYGDAEKVNTPKAYREFIVKHPESGRCADAAQAGARLAEQGKYLDQWPELLQALGQYNCNGSVDVLQKSIKFPIGEVRVAASGSLLRLSAPSKINPTETVKPTDLDSILAQAGTDPDPVVRANLRCIAVVTDHGASLDRFKETSPYVLRADKSCRSGELSAVYGRP